jgi:hypothetical protein
MDPIQSGSLLKSPISLEQDSLRCDTFVLIDSVATLSVLSQMSFNQNSLVGNYIRGPKLIVYNALEKRDMQCFLLAAVSPTIHSFSEKAFLGL